jgi:hypothetical protein
MIRALSVNLSHHFKALARRSLRVVSGNTPECKPIAKRARLRGSIHAARRAQAISFSGVPSSKLQHATLALQTASGAL